MRAYTKRVDDIKSEIVKTLMELTFHHVWEVVSIACHRKDGNILAVQKSQAMWSMFKWFHVTAGTGPKRNSEFCFPVTGSVPMAAHATENTAEKQSSYFRSQS